MVYKQILLTFILLVLVAGTGAVFRLRTTDNPRDDIKGLQNSGVHIPLKKRVSLTRADGTFDHKAAQVQLARTFKCVHVI